MRALMQARTHPGRGSLRPPAASRCCARKLAARSFPRRPPAAWSGRTLATCPDASGQRRCARRVVAAVAAVAHAAPAAPSRASGAAPRYARAAGAGRYHAERPSVRVAHAGVGSRCAVAHARPSALRRRRATERCALRRWSAPWQLRDVTSRSVASTRAQPTPHPSRSARSAADRDVRAGSQLTPRPRSGGSPREGARSELASGAATGGGGPQAPPTRISTSNARRACAQDGEKAKKRSTS